jgi:hypothetical protein
MCTELPCPKLRDGQDISMIALPRSKGHGDYFDRLVEEAKSISLPPTVAIVAWDDLVEH